MIRVMIIDDHVVVRAGLKYMLESDGEMNFVGEFGGGIGAVEAVHENNPDVVLLDVRMPDRNGIEVLQDLRADNPSIRVVMLTTSDAEEDVFRAIEDGARGYVMKEAPVGEILAAIRGAMAGEIVMNDEVRHIYETRKEAKGLSVREIEVLSQVREGLSNREIGEKLGVSENSVKMYLKRINFKLGAGDRAEALNLALKRGFLK